MVLDPPSAARLTGPAAIDGIGPADGWQSYWQKTDAVRRQASSWAQLDTDRKWHARIAASVLAGAAASVAALPRLRYASAAQAAYPGAGPIRIIVPFAPAGPVDILARVIVDPLARQLGQSVVIENRGGAGGNIAVAAAARAKPDGYTLLLCSSSLVVNPLLYKSVPYDPVKDFVPISLLGTSPNLMLAKPEFAKTMMDFIAIAKARPGQLNYSTPGIGTKGHFAVELLKQRAGIDLQHVPYPSGGQVVQSLLTGTTQLGSTALPAGEPLVRGGTLPGWWSAANGAGARCPRCRR